MDSPVVPCAASTLAPGWLHDAEVPARVLSSFPGAAYLLPLEPGLTRPRGGVDVLALVGPGALRLPGAVVVPDDGLLRSGLDQGATVQVGEGRVRAPSAVLEVRRRWTPAQVVPVDPVDPADPADSVDPADPADSVDPRQAELVGRLVHAIDASTHRPGRPDLGRLADDVLQDPGQVVRLLGLGPGLTPSGDDVLAGLLLGLRAVGRHEDRTGRALATEVLDGLWRTTALSGTLLRAAARGYAVPPVVDLLAALHGRIDDQLPPPADRVARLVREVARTGHTSGADLLVGVRAALRVGAPALLAHSLTTTTTYGRA